MTKLSTSPYKGTRDYYPEDLALRNYVFSKWREVCNSFGYEEYDASVLEPLELYASKTSEEIVSQQTFSFEDRGGRKVTLRPEMTPTVSRMVAARRQELGYPLRLFSIPNCFRYERMQRGRTREFWQLNVDLFGVAGIEGELEIAQVMDRTLKVFGATPDMYEIRVNSRKSLNAMIEAAKPKQDVNSVLRVVDAIDKLSTEEFALKLSEVLKDPKSLIEALKSNQPNEELETLIQKADKLGIKLKYSPELARGFDYYTDIVFEVFDKNPENNRSMFGGGRYDGLVKTFGAEAVPTIGFGMGDAPLYNFLEVNNLIPKVKLKTDVMLIPITEDDLENVNDVANQLRSEGKNVAIDYDITRKFDKRMKSAQKLKIPQIATIENGELKFKDLL
ncbi:MAG TPA: histidine--tRNA ligase [Candidatus Saccharimonadales bacterium]|nr:histidine--tRNA ligase [Candidatus Saccharimonadales bacterium]